MSPVRHVVLLVQGDPIVRVWLPRRRLLDALTAEVRLSDNGAEAVRRKVKSLGLTPNVRIVSHPRGVDFQPWVNWVKQGETPRGFDELSLEEAQDDPVFGAAIRALQRQLSARD
jgi:hypothetical protein